MLYKIHISTGATVLLSTPDMTAARKLADRLAVIYDGRIIASGDADIVFASPDPLVAQLLTGAVSGPLGLRGSG